MLYFNCIRMSMSALMPSVASKSIAVFGVRVRLWFKMSLRAVYGSSICRASEV